MRYLVHGTTVATNAIIEGNLSKTAFITTEGFRDLLEIQTGIRPVLYDLQFEKLRPLVPRYLCFGVPERMDFRGDVLVPLDEAAVCQVADQLRDEGVGSVAVCLLHSYGVCKPCQVPQGESQRCRSKHRLTPLGSR